MNKSEWLLIGSCALGCYGVGQVWLVQMSSYPLWSYVGPGDFSRYHAAWWRSIWGVILAPAAVSLLGSLLMLWWRAPGVPAWAAQVAFALQATLALGTAIWWGPLMARLEAPGGGLVPDRYQLLLATHWLRVGIVTLYALLLLWMLAQSAGRP